MAIKIIRRGVSQTVGLADAGVVGPGGKGQLQNAIHRTLPLEEIAQAREEMERSEYFGTLVATID